MTRNEMLAMYFVHDGGDTAKWRLKGHAETDFWRFVASWSVMLSKPSDLGFSADGYELQLGTNHLGHFLLTNLLMPALTVAESARVVNLTSAGHSMGNVDFDNEVEITVSAKNAEGKKKKITLKVSAINEGHIYGNKNVMITT